MTPKGDMTKIANTLFRFAIEDPYFVKNKNGDVYMISSRDAREWFKEQSNIPKNLTDIIGEPDIKEVCYKHMYTAIDELILPVKQNDFFEKLKQAFNDDEMSSTELKDEINNILADEDLDKVLFMSRCFLWCIIQKNDSHKISRAKPKQGSSYDKNLDALKKMMDTLAKPVRIDIPDNPTEDEMFYIEALMEAYSDDAKIVFASKDDLNSFEKYRNNFDRQRKDFYAAESVRRGVRDSLLQEENGEFDKLKNEVYDSVIDVVESDYSSGFERLKGVMTHVTTVKLSNLIAQIPDWIEASEKKGLCHMLVNDKKFKWVKDKENE